jgi:hypothetical protein
MLYKYDTHENNRIVHGKFHPINFSMEVIDMLCSQTETSEIFIITSKIMFIVYFSIKI